EQYRMGDERNVKRPAWPPVTRPERQKASPPRSARRAPAPVAGTCLASPTLMAHGHPVDPILVIDDDPECCAITADMLERAGYRVEWTVDVAFALPRIRERRYALVVSDIDMPRMAGTVLAAEAMRVVPRIPTVLVSGRSDGATRIAARALGAHLLVKPFGRQALLSAIAELMPRPPAAAA